MVLLNLLLDDTRLNDQNLGALRSSMPHCSRLGRYERVQEPLYFQGFVRFPANFCVNQSIDIGIHEKECHELD